MIPNPCLIVARRRTTAKVYAGQRRLAANLIELGERVTVALTIEALWGPSRAGQLVLVATTGRTLETVRVAGNVL